MGLLKKMTSEQELTLQLAGGRAFQAEYTLWQECACGKPGWPEQCEREHLEDVIRGQNVRQSEQCLLGHRQGFEMYFYFAERWGVRNGFRQSDLI